MKPIGYIFATINRNTGSGNICAKTVTAIAINNTENPMSNPAEIPDNISPLEFRFNCVSAASSVCCKITSWLFCGFCSTEDFLFFFDNDIYKYSASEYNMRAH